MDRVNQRIIDAVIARAESVCPGSLALIGIYGSVATGDLYPGSDLDLLILIKDNDGWQLGSGFILDDSGIGYDIYCTNWDGLRWDAGCHHSQISKLMDSQIVYIKDQEAYEELLRLREQARSVLESDERFERVGEQIKQAKEYYAEACLREDMRSVRMNCAGIILSLLSAIMLHHGCYFRRGTKRTFDELAQFPLDAQFIENLRRVPFSTDAEELRSLARQMILYAEQYTARPAEKVQPCADNVAGTYEEMYSNWRNKVQEAADRGDTYSSFMNICFLQAMIDEISAGTDIGDHDIMGRFNADNLQENAVLFDQFLESYAKVYERAGISVRHFADVDAFFRSYTGKE